VGPVMDATSIIDEQTTITPWGAPTDSCLANQAYRDGHAAPTATAVHSSLSWFVQVSHARMYCLSYLRGCSSYVMVRGAADEFGEGVGIGVHALLREPVEQHPARL
jgi:hypothetical protein